MASALTSIGGIKRIRENETILRLESFTHKNNPKKIDEVIPDELENEIRYYLIPRVDVEDARRKNEIYDQEDLEALAG